MTASPVPVALTVAAHDPLGGAGVAADLTTFATLGAHGTAVLTAVTAQHLSSVDRVVPVDLETVVAQLDGVAADLPPKALKTGLLGSAAVVHELADRVAGGRLPRPVVDPVLVDGRGEPLPVDGLEAAYRSSLIPSAIAVTPNLAEAAVLAGGPIRSVADAIAAAPELAALGADLVVVTGGAAPGSEAIDVVIDPTGTATEVAGPWVDHRHVRGSGCTFSAALALHLGLVSEPMEAVHAAKAFVAARLVATAWPGIDDVGPVAHWQTPAQGTSAHSSP